MFSSIAEEDEMGEDFFSKLAMLEDSHNKKPTEATSTQLIQMYSDSVQYFDTNSEPVAIYFQTKLRKLMLMAAPKKPEAVEKRKKAEAVLEEGRILSEMAQEGHVEYVLQKQLVGVEEYEKKIVNIIDRQKEELQSRRKRNLRKCLTKSASLTLSVDSMFDSPSRIERSKKKMDTMNLFESLIDSGD